MLVLLMVLVLGWHPRVLLVLLCWCGLCGWCGWCFALADVGCCLGLVVVWLVMVVGG